MTYQPIPEERRRELAAFIPDLAEARRKLGVTPSNEAERQFWTKHVLDIQKMNSRGPTDAAERLWLLRHAHLAAVGTDPTQVSCFAWPGFCARTGRTAAEEDWPLEPIPGAKVPPKETPGPKRADDYSVVIEGRVVKPGDTILVRPGVLAPGDDPKRTVRRVEVNGYDRRVWFTNDRWRHPTDLTFGASALRQAPSFDFGDPTTITDSDVKRTSLQVFSDYMMSTSALEVTTPPILVDRTAFQQFPSKLENTMNQATPSKLENTMNQATPYTAASFAFDASNIVEVKTFVFGRDIATLDDDTLLNYVQSLTGAIEHLEQLNAKTPLVKLVTKIAQLKDAKAKIVELLGGAPVEQASPAIDADETKPKRVRRTKAEIEADNAAQARAEIKAAPIPLTPPPASKVDPDPSADVDDLDLE